MVLPGHLADAVADAVAGLDAGTAAVLVGQAARGPAALRQLSQHLAAHPDALATGSGDVPLPVARLAGLLAGAGYGGIRVPACLACGRTGELPHRSAGGRLCRNCYRKQGQQRCSRCGRTRIVSTRTPAGPLCPPCAAALRPPRLCGACGQVRPAVARREDGTTICQPCYQAPQRPCSRCGQTARTNAFTPQGPVCGNCYARPPRRCGGCGQDRPIRLRAAAGQPDLCSKCSHWPASACAACGQQGRCDSRSGQPLCMICCTQPAHECRACGNARPLKALWPMGPVCGDCYQQIRSHPADCPRCGQHQVLTAAAHDGSRICGPCAGHPPEFACTTCAAACAGPGQRTCARCAMNQHLHATLADPVLGIPAQFQPLLAAFTQAANPGSVSDWLRRRPGGKILTELAATAHHQQITHHLLDERPQTRALHHVRDVLVSAGVLSPRAEYLERISPWLDTILTSRPPHHASLVRPYATWHVLRRARQRARKKSFTHSAAAQARTHILAALHFLAWLDARGQALATATQADIDNWLDGTTCNRYQLRPFITWAARRHLTSDLTIPALPRTEPAPALTENDRWHQLRRCLHDDDLPLDIRTAGALLLLYGQFISRLTELTTDCIEHNGSGTFLRLDTTPVLLPPRLAALVCAQRDATPPKLTLHPATATRPLFPGHSPARPITPAAMTRRLRQHGIDPQQARNAALTAWAADLPPAVLASLLGVHIQTATNWATRTGRDWASYIATRISTPGNTARTE